MLIVDNRHFKTEIEICQACGHFLEVRKITGDWVCFDCIPEGQTSSYVGGISKKNIRIKKTFEISQPKVKSRKTKNIQTSKKQKSEKSEFESCQKFLKTLFSENPNKVFKSTEIYHMLDNRFDQRNVSNYLCLMAKEGFIHTRKINHEGINSFTLCSRNQELVERLIPEETAYKYREYIFEHAPICTVKLSAAFGHSFKNVSTLISRKLLSDIGVIKVGNKNYYYPLNKKDEMLTLIEKMR